MPPPNVIFFGEVGGGKSSIVNLIAERELATISTSANGCTFASERYPVNIQGTRFNLYDTAGVDSWEMNQAAIVQLFRLLKELDNGVSLLVLCIRGRIKEDTHKIWRLFHEIICRRQVPIVLAITGLEYEEKMDEWWVRNKGAFQKYAIYPQGVGCITPFQGRILQSGTRQWEAKYEESTVKMWDLLRAQCLEEPWKVQPVEWLRDTTIQDLVSRCGMTQAEAKKIGEVLSNV